MTTTTNQTQCAYSCVTAFGAKCDGITDDTAAVQAALDSGLIVHLPSGNILCGPIKLKSGGGLVGAGNASRFIVAPGSGDFITGDSLSNVILEKFYVDCSAQADGGGCGMKITGFQRSMIRDVTIYNAGSFGWLIFGSVQSRYVGNTIDTTRKWDGMTITGSTDNIIQGNTVINSYDSGIGLTDTTHTVVTGNVINRQKVSGNYFAPGIDASGAKDAAITGNYVSGCEAGVQIVVHPNTGKVPQRVSASGNTIANGNYGIKAGYSVLDTGITQEAAPLNSINLSGNSINGMSVEGIHADSIADSSINGNLITNSSTGIYLNSCLRVSILSNKASLNITGIALDTANNSLSAVGNISENNSGNNWAGTGLNNAYMVHNRNGGVDYSMSGHESYVSNWDFPGHLQIGPYHFWIDSSGRVRIKNGTPTSDADGAIVGNQS